MAAKGAGEDESEDDYEPELGRRRGRSSDAFEEPKCHFCNGKSTGSSGVLYCTSLGCGRVLCTNCVEEHFADVYSRQDALADGGALAPAREGPSEQPAGEGAEYDRAGEWICVVCRRRCCCTYPDGGCTRTHTHCRMAKKQKRKRLAAELGQAPEELAAGPRLRHRSSAPSASEKPKKAQPPQPTPPPSRKPTPQTPASLAPGACPGPSTGPHASTPAASAAKGGSQVVHGPAQPAHGAPHDRAPARTGKESAANGSVSGGHRGNSASGLTIQTQLPPSTHRTSQPSTPNLGMQSRRGAQQAGVKRPAGGGERTPLAAGAAPQPLGASASPAAGAGPSAAAGPIGASALAAGATDESLARAAGAKRSRSAAAAAAAGSAARSSARESPRVPAETADGLAATASASAPTALLRVGSGGVGGNSALAARANGAAAAGGAGQQHAAGACSRERESDLDATCAAASAFVPSLARRATTDGSVSAAPLHGGAGGAGGCRARATAGESGGGGEGGGGQLAGEAGLGNAAPMRIARGGEGGGVGHVGSGGVGAGAHEFKGRLRAIREHLGLSQPQFGALLRPAHPVNQQTLSRWEAGLCRVPTEAMAHALELLRRGSVGTPLGGCAALLGAEAGGAGPGLTAAAAAAAAAAAEHEEEEDAKAEAGALGDGGSYLTSSDYPYQEPMLGDSYQVLPRDIPQLQALPTEEEEVDADERRAGTCEWACPWRGGEGCALTEPELESYLGQVRELCVSCAAIDYSEETALSALHVLRLDVGAALDSLRAAVAWHRGDEAQLLDIAPQALMRACVWAGLRAEPAHPVSWKAGEVAALDAGMLLYDRDLLAVHENVFAERRLRDVIWHYYRHGALRRHQHAVQALGIPSPTVDTLAQ